MGSEIQKGLLRKRLLQSLVYAHGTVTDND